MITISQAATAVVRKICAKECESKEKCKRRRHTVVALIP
jgi:hypothetical protein